MLLRDLFEASSSPKVIFVLGAASQGKSSVADNVIEGEYGYTLIDMDRPADVFRQEYGIPDTIPAKTDADKARDDERKAKRASGELPPAPKMADFADPAEYMKAIPKGKHGPHHAMLAGAEVTKRHSAQALQDKENVVFVETGGKAGMGKRIEMLQGLGYEVYCIFVGIHPELDLNSEQDFQKVASMTIQRQKQRKRQLDDEVIMKNLKISQKTKEKVLPLFKNLEYVDTGTLDQEQSKQRTREIMKGWGL